MSRTNGGSTSTTPIFMLGPVGLLNPFRSPFMKSGLLDKKLEEINNISARISTQAEQTLTAIQHNEPGGGQRLAMDGRALEAFWNDHESLLTLLAKEPDFQAQQFVKLNEALLRPSKLSLDEMREALAWQTATANAVGKGTVPPPPPPKLQEFLKAAGVPFPEYGFPDDSRFDFPGDEATREEREVGYGNGDFTSGVRAVPLLPDAGVLRKADVRAEYDALVHASEELAMTGKDYGLWSCKDKLAYIQKVEEVEGRWMAFMAKIPRPELNAEFVRQARWYGGSLGIQHEDAYLRLLQVCRALLRSDAGQCLG